MGGDAAVRLLLLADTHLPRRARELPAQVWAAVDAADVVVHAGDWVDAATVEALAARARRLVGVAGNNDGPDVRALVPAFASFTAGGVRFGVVHETGAAAGRERRCDALHAGALDVLVFGHSHVPWDSTTASGLRLLNPGSPTDRRRQPACTYLTLTAAGGAVRDVVLHALPPRPPQPRRTATRASAPSAASSVSGATPVIQSSTSTPSVARARSSTWASSSRPGE
ncbi:metallophosphoesterase family protein [Kineococcus gypseus]|uniref:metallophosphoesterase family protein n=1 Tax=Kineococcus gypseus TaxID=1637102 RepID=UPI003D7DDA55